MQLLLPQNPRIHVSPWSDLSKTSIKFYARPELPNAAWPDNNSFVYSFDSAPSLFPKPYSLMYRESNDVIWEAKYSWWANSWNWSRHEILPTVVESFLNLPTYNTVFHTHETRDGFFHRLKDTLFGNKINQFYINNWNGSTLLEKREIGTVKFDPQSLQSLYGQDTMVFGIPTLQTVQYQQPPKSTVELQPATIGQRPPVKFIRFVQRDDVPKPSVSSESGYALVYDIKAPTQLTVGYNKQLPAQDHGRPPAVLPIRIPDFDITLANPRIIRRELISG